jgi:hypothetical protein
VLKVEFVIGINIHLIQPGARTQQEAAGASKLNSYKKTNIFFLYFAFILFLFSLEFFPQVYLAPNKGSHCLRIWLANLKYQPISGSPLVHKVVKIYSWKWERVKERLFLFLLITSAIKFFYFIVMLGGGSF